jgi:hypothetical protein
MNKIYLILLFPCILLLVFCGTRKYGEIQNLDGASKEYQTYVKKEFPTGAKLYRQYCTGCHGIFSAGKDSVPNFSKTQIDGYNLAFIQADSTNHAVASGISQEEFERILLFLTFRKKD